MKFSLQISTENLKENWEKIKDFVEKLNENKHLWYLKKIWENFEKMFEICGVEKLLARFRDYRFVAILNYSWKAF